jgi:hypothetical protein
MFHATRAGAVEQASFAHCGAKFQALAGQIWACSLAPNHVRTHRGDRERHWCWSDGDAYIVLG